MQREFTFVKECIFRQRLQLHWFFFGIKYFFSVKQQNNIFPYVFGTKITFVFPKRRIMLLNEPKTMTPFSCCYLKKKKERVIY
jgi:hypothetical protein